MKIRGSAIFSLIACFLVSLFILIATQTSYKDEESTIELAPIVNLTKPIAKQKLTHSENEVLEIIKCHDGKLKTYFGQRGAFYVFYNYIKAMNTYKCEESITLTSPGDFRFLDNVIPLVNRWDGPISIALYAPGHDFYTTLEAIAYLRVCTTPAVVERVTFSLFFEIDHMPKQKDSKIPLKDVYLDAYNCSKPAPWENIKDESMYKTKEGLLYPINVARNVAKVTAQTHFVFPSDIELYPTFDFVRKFLEMVPKYPTLFQEESKNVFVLPIFEILADSQVPENKTTLKNMLDEGSAFLFHKSVCDVCHKIPKQKDWSKAEESDDLSIFVTGKRQGEQLVWEPFFICTANEPLWDERLSWEGQGNKMCQAFTMCVMDYDFHVLDNAFLIHKPGVKKKKVQNIKHKDQLKVNNNILRSLQKDIFQIYGKNNRCMVHYV